MDIELGKEIGATEQTSTQRLTLYLPNKDKNDQVVENFPRWLTEARVLLGEIGGGSTAFPPADGTWINDEAQVVWEETRIVYCFIRPELLIGKVKSLRELLHRFGRETNQGEVIVEFDGRFYRIRRFDPPAES